MHYIALLKQVPDISNIPPDAWDLEKGTLKRQLLDNVTNPLDLHALTLALRMREKDPQPGKVIALSMGPAQAIETLHDGISRGADAGVLLSDISFAGADTVATAYSLARGINRIGTDLLKNEPFMVVAGMQSVDGDTAQVPPQIAEELGAELIAYVTDWSWKGDNLIIQRIGAEGSEKISADYFPLVITATDCTETVYPSFSLTRMAKRNEIPCYTWNATDIGAEKEKSGSNGSLTRVVKIFSPEASYKECHFTDSASEVTKFISQKIKSDKTSAASSRQNESSYISNKSYSGEVWIIAEAASGKLTDPSLELLMKARELASSLNEKVGAVILGNNIERLANELISKGADTVYMADSIELASFASTPYKYVVTEFIKEYKPQILLFTASPLGRELAPRVAYNVKGGLTADCTQLEIGSFKESDGIMLQTRPALGGNIMATITTKPGHLQIATVRPGVFQKGETVPNHSGNIIKYEKDIPSSRLNIISREKTTNSVTYAGMEIIVSGGGGLRNKDNFDLYIKPLVEELSAYYNVPVAFSASRRAVELGIINREHQIGQTGQTVQPRIYLAIGISGSVQHISGILKSDFIIAVNPDPSAPIFRIADIGIIDKAEQFVPQLLQLLKGDNHE